MSCRNPCGSGSVWQSTTHWQQVQQGAFNLGLEGHYGLVVTPEDHAHIVLLQHEFGPLGHLVYSCH